MRRLCELLEVERSSFDAWHAAAPARHARAAADAERVNHKRVARLMRQEQIRGYRRRRKVRTTIPEPADQTVPDLLRRDFTAEAANQRYVGDITYLRSRPARGRAGRGRADAGGCRGRGPVR